MEIVVKQEEERFRSEMVFRMDWDHIQSKEEKARKEENGMEVILWAIAGQAVPKIKEAETIGKIDQDKRGRTVKPTFRM